MSAREAREIGTWFDERTEEWVISRDDLWDVVTDLTERYGSRVTIAGEVYDIRVMMTSHDTPAVNLRDLAFILSNLDGGPS